MPLYQRAVDVTRGFPRQRFRDSFRLTPDVGAGMGSPLKIKEDRTPAELRRLARRERGGRIAARLYAIANALDGMSRAAAAQLAGMERQALHAVLRYNTEDLAGLRDHPK